MFSPNVLQLWIGYKFAAKQAGHCVNVTNAFDYLLLVTDFLRAYHSTLTPQQNG